MHHEYCKRISMMKINGAHGEGGGELVRIAVALAASTGKAIAIDNVRAKRKNPGLAAQHVASIQAVARLCNARLQDVFIGSAAFSFIPGPLQGGSWHLDIGTAGSIPLVFQALLPAACLAPAPVHFTVTGGTDVPQAPPMDYYRFVFMPMLGKMGMNLSVELHKRGYYPRGGGMATLHVLPSRLKPLELIHQGEFLTIEGLAHVANLPAHISQRMAKAAAETLAPWPTCIQTENLDENQAAGQGGGIVLWAKTTTTILGASCLARRGVPAEKIGQEAAFSLKQTLQTKAALDEHLADQIMPYAALSQKPCRFTASSFTLHAQTIQWLLQQFLPVRINAEKLASLIHIDVRPMRHGDYAF